jgi:hypothetical protein
MDMIYFLPNEQGFTHNLPEERLITNYRMSCVIESFLALDSENNVMIIDVILEPLLFAFGMRQVRKSWEFYFKVMKHVDDMLKVHYKPFIKPYFDAEERKKKNMVFGHFIITDILEKKDPDKDVIMYINTPGGEVNSGLAIYDTMQILKCDVQTICT